MKQLFWISSVHVPTQIFMGAAVVQAKDHQGALGIADSLGITPTDEVEVMWVQLPWEERLKYTGHMHRLLTGPEVRSLGCKTYGEWLGEESNGQ